MKIVLLLSLLSLACCLLNTRRSNSNMNSKNSISNKNDINSINSIRRLQKLYMAGPGADYIPDDLPQIDYDKLPKIEQSMKDNLDNVLTAFIADATIKTVSYYMLEFRDEINQRWMVQFGNFSYERDGSLSDGKWYQYIESMIKTDKHAIQVIMKTPKSFLRGKSSPEGNNVMVQYDHNIEPRKIAHKLLTVREDVSNELISDLGCILLENVEAMRYATAKAHDGVEAAEKSRRQTRMSYEGGCTPLRDRNYNDLSVLLTNAAIDLVKSTNKDNKEYQVFLDDFLNKMAADDKERNPLDRILHEPIGPRELIEEIYYLGLIEGVDKSSKSINILRLGKLLLDFRLALAVEITKICKAQNLEHRAYYRMITEHGGFQKIDLSGEPKYRLLDLDAEKRNAEKAALEEKNNPQIIPKETLVEQQAQNEAMITESSETTISTPNNADEEDVFDWNVGQSGPTLM